LKVRNTDRGGEETEPAAAEEMMRMMMMINGYIVCMNYLRSIDRSMDLSSGAL
jgi:hypothetical protein